MSAESMLSPRPHRPKPPGKHAFPGVESELFALAGKACFGPYWQAAVALRTGLATPRLARMITGARPISPASWGAMAALVAQRVQELSALQDLDWPGAKAGTQQSMLFLQQIGETAFSTKWKLALAQDLLELAPDLFRESMLSPGPLVREPERRIGRMASGKQPIPPTLWPELQRLLRDRIQGLEEVLPELQRRAQAG